MKIIEIIRQAFVAPLTSLLSESSLEPSTIDSVLANALTMIRPAQNAQFGDYQANFAMPLSKKVGMKSVEVAQAVVERAELEKLFSKVEVAGPGFINLSLSDELLTAAAQEAYNDPDHLGLQLPPKPKTIVIDYSSPNVAKPMHVGHIRTTVIGDALSKICRFLGHNVITDNHIGDWGTQFGMIIYGYRHFLNPEAYQQSPVLELSRLYRQVRAIMDVLEKQASLPKLKTALAQHNDALNDAKANLATANDGGDKKAIKSAKQKVTQCENKIKETLESIEETEAKLATAQADQQLMKWVEAHSEIGTAVLQETSKLHAGDQDNLNLWKEILPHCHDEMDRVYDRLDIEFDHVLGESFYHEQLGPLVEDMKGRGLVQESEGAQCVFVDNFDSPMIVQKRDGAYLYATTDLATIEYRMQNWKPDTMLYVVDARQKEHFDKLFAVADKMGYADVEKVHVSFGTVMGPDGKPYKTRSGDTIGLEGFINEAAQYAYKVVAELDDGKQNGPEFDEAQRREIAETVGVGALKFGDLSQNRTSDYKFEFEKMVATDGDTATYIQYGFARVNGIFTKVGITPDALHSKNPVIKITNEGERALALAILRFEDALQEVLVDYRPNLLCSYLIDLTRNFYTFYNRKDCRVEGAEPEVQNSRLALCDLVARTLESGLQLLGINVVPKM